MEQINAETDIWKVIYSYFDNNKYYMTNHHLDSFNDYILNKIPQTFKENNPQILYLAKNEETKNYKFELEIYYGGENGDKITIGKPIIYHGENIRKQMYPNEARLKNLNYSTHIFCDILVKYKINDDEGNTIEENVITFDHMSLCSIPIMLHSKLCVLNNQSFETLRSMGECPYEQGGYFIVEGKEKVIVSHERKAENKLYVQTVNDGINTHTINIKSIPQGKFKYPKTTEISIKIIDDSMNVRLPGFNKKVPLFVIFRFLGLESDKEILENIFNKLDDDVNQELIDEMIPSIKEGSVAYTQHGAGEFLKQFTQHNIVSQVYNIITNELIPHVGNNYTNKAVFLGYMVRKLLYRKKNLIKNTDRDSFANKRVDLSGFLLAALFRDSFLQFQRRTKIELDKEYRFNSDKYKENIMDIINESNIRNIFDSNKMEKDYMFAFKIGTILNKKGLIQALSRRTFSDIISHTRRINTPKGNVMIAQRKLHSTQYGMFCPVEAPDGGNVGIKKHMSIMTHITFGCDTKPLEKCVREFGLMFIQEIDVRILESSGKVFLNGNILGIHHNISYLIRVLKLFRRNSLINIFTSFNWDTRFNELFISTDGGRCSRPLLIVENNKLILTKKIINDLDKKIIGWDNLVGGFMDNRDKLDYYNCDYSCPKSRVDLLKKLEKTQAVFEYIDVDELDNILISSKPDELKDNDITLKNFTHCELHPTMIFGHLGFYTPFANNSQSVRNIFGAGQGKQAVGIYTSNFRYRMDNGAHTLNYPQKPLVNNKMAEYIFNSKLPCGNNIIVAIASYSGYNQEDAVIINKNSLDRGLFNTTYYKVYESMESVNKQKGVSEFFYSPKNDQKNVNPHKDYNYSKLDEFGVVKENSYVFQNDVLIGQYRNSVDEGNFDTSTSVKKDGGGLVDKVYMFNTNSDNSKLCKIRLISTRVPDVGDKFASRHGQKGTVGCVMEAKNMPYTKEGIIPDMIINPHAFPSRMTIGQFLESLGGKIGLGMGFIFDGTTFEEQSIEELGDVLQSNNGYHKHGTEVMYSGITGKQLEADIFIGPTFYQRLKQMVQDKINSRAPGKINYLTKQPPAGRAAGGGLRIGEMERDAIISHGIANFLKESTVDRSDGRETDEQTIGEYYICDHTGEIVGVNKDNNVFVSPAYDGPLEFEGNKAENLKLAVRDNKSYSFSKVKIPYSVKLLIQECGAMGISLKVLTDNTKDNFSTFTDILDVKK